MDGTLFPINVAPFEAAAFAPPHTSGNDEFEVGFVFDTLSLQRRYDFLCRFRIRNFLFIFAPDVAVGAPRRIVREKATLHGIREDAAQRSVHALNGVLGEWLFCVEADDFSHLCVEISEVFWSQFGELVMPQCREDALNVLSVTADSGFGQFAGGNGFQPQVDVFCQRELLDGLRRVAAFSLE